MVVDGEQRRLVPHPFQLHHSFALQETREELVETAKGSVVVHRVEQGELPLHLLHENR